MARCSCGNAACSCVIKAAPDGGVLVTGSGSPERPYLISTSTGSKTFDSLEMVDSSTVKWSKSGAGTPADHRRYIATTDVSMAELTDVSKTDIPITGDVVQWNGTQWVFAPPGATSVPVSGVFGTAPLNIYGANPLIGPSIYLDSNGQIRGKPDTIASGTFGPTEPVVSYPLGVSVMTLFTAANGGAWPFGVSGFVTTYHRYEGGAADTGGYQIWSRNSSTLPQLMIRVANGSAWTPWAYLGGLAPHYSAFKTVAQAMATANTWYTATYENIETNEGGITYSGGVFTVPMAGKYAIDWSSHIQGTTATTSVTLRLLKNGASIGDYTYSAVGTNKSWQMCKVVKCNAGDTLSAQARTSTAGTNMYGAAGTKYTYIDITLVGG